MTTAADIVIEVQRVLALSKADAAAAVGVLVGPAGGDEDKILAFLRAQQQTFAVEELALRFARYCADQDCQLKANGRDHAAPRAANSHAGAQDSGADDDEIGDACEPGGDDEARCEARKHPRGNGQWQHPPPVDELQDAAPILGSRDGSAMPLPLNITDPTDFQGRIIPERRWAVPNWVPVPLVTGLYDDGGTGKSLLLQMLLTSAALGREWLGIPIRKMRALAIFCEDPQDELQRRQRTSIATTASTCAISATCRWLCRHGMDNLLVEFDGISPILSPVYLGHAIGRGSSTELSANATAEPVQAVGQLLKGGQALARSENQARHR